MTTDRAFERVFLVLLFCVAVVLLLDLGWPRVALVVGGFIGGALVTLGLARWVLGDLKCRKCGTPFAKGWKYQCR